MITSHTQLALRSLPLRKPLAAAKLALFALFLPEVVSTWAATAALSIELATPPVAVFEFLPLEPLLGGF